MALFVRERSRKNTSQPLHLPNLSVYPLVGDVFDTPPAKAGRFLGGFARPLTGQRSDLMELSLRQRSSSHQITQNVGSAMMPATRMENLSVHSPEILPVLCLKALVRHLLRGALPKQLLRTRSGGVASALPLASQDNMDTDYSRECFGSLNAHRARRVPEPTGSYVPPKGGTFTALLALYSIV